MISQDGMADEVSGNLRRRGAFDSFSEERIHPFLEVMRNKVEFDLKDSQKAAGQ